MRAINYHNNYLIVVVIWQYMCAPNHNVVHIKPACVMFISQNQKRKYCSLIIFCMYHLNAEWIKDSILSVSYCQIFRWFHCCCLHLWWLLTPTTQIRPNFTSRGHNSHTNDLTSDTSPKLGALLPPLILTIWLHICELQVNPQVP